MRKPPSTTTANSDVPATSTKISTPCCTKVGLKRGPWTPEEDELLANYINREGEGRWRTLPKRAGLLRCGKSCRLRWMNYLRPCVKRGQIAPDEEDLILRLHRLLGNRWSLIAGRIPGRTDNEIKNYWNTHLSKKLISQGIDPRTHKPLDPGSLKLSLISNTSNAKPTSKSSTSTPPDQINDHMIMVTADHKNHHPILQTHSGGDHIAHQYHPNSTTTSTALHHDQLHLGHRSFTGLLNMSSCEDEYSGAAEMRGEDDIIMTNYSCGAGADDVFSSFLNSLINDEAAAFSAHHHSTDDPLLSISGLGGSTSTTTWPEAHLVDSTNSNYAGGLNHHDHDHSKIIGNHE